MEFNRKHGKLAVALSAVAVATAAIAGTLMQLQPEVVVSTAAAANNAYKAKMGWQSYKSSLGESTYDVKAQLVVYADGPAGKQDIWIARSTDDGATWTQTNVTNNGGTSLAITDPVSSKTGTFSITHYKPSIYVAPVGVLNGGKGANALVSWTSSDCEGSPAQRINSNLVPLTGKDQPYSCLWTARSSDGGQTWTTQRLTNGGKDADNDVLGGSVKYTSDTTSSGHFAVAFQADPEGLQLGEAEGTGDGASGANVSPGTNIWYTYLKKSDFEAGTDFPLPGQVSDNNATTDGSPGASRPNLFLSGGNAILAYEETKGSGSSGKQVIYHSFSANSPTLDSLPAGTAISNPSNNARRVRFVAQGDEALGDADKNGDAADGDTQGVHVLLLWRETTLTGHLVLATLHTNDATSAVTRLTDMGVEPFLLSSSLLGVLAQRLVRQLCTQCHGTGCDKCGQTGYSGRSGVFELLITDDAIRAQIHTKASEADIRQAARAAGMTLMREDGERLVQSGVTSREELIRVTRD
ncbi:ATPase, T2SS/T4P/T4SS family [Rhodoferax sp. PAMC 29310]|uniref:ATPase, T2SS/T4P/T4SS family n=1 Tax=Rhodoferax sp. PAMC 29310 TaxID=2822760 RepID=UPI001F0B5715|nr:ATPase, T2SS/T4P/T4SS family [Rhodoferax sp. PAMC 29310]